MTARTLWAEPRSTVIHWLSDQLLLQRLESVPSTALPGVYDVSNCVLDALAGCP
jgi:hypothetical protein